MSMCISLCPHEPTPSMYVNSVHISLCSCLWVCIHVCQSMPMCIKSVNISHVQVCHSTFLHVSCVHVYWPAHVPVCMLAMFLCISQLITMSAYQAISIYIYCEPMSFSVCVHVNMSAHVHTCPHMPMYTHMIHVSDLHVCMTECAYRPVYMHKFTYLYIRVSGQCPYMSITGTCTWTHKWGSVSMFQC